MTENVDGLGAVLLRRALDVIGDETLASEFPGSAMSFSSGQTLTLSEILDGHDPDSASVAVWQALTLLCEQLPENSAWKVRVQGIQRRNHYGTTIAGSNALKTSVALRDAGISHGIFGDLALATRYRRRGDRAVNRLAVAVDPRTSRRRLAGCIASVDGLTIDSSQRNLLIGRFGPLPVSFHRGWSASMGGRRLPLETESKELGWGKLTDSDSWADPDTVRFVARPIELLRLVTSASDPANPDHGSDSWLLDLTVLLHQQPDAAVRALDLARCVSAEDQMRWAFNRARFFGIDLMIP